MNGTVYPFFGSNYDWDKANDGDETQTGPGESQTITQNTSDAFIELDFGQERNTNRVRLRHHVWFGTYSNGSTLYLMNGLREVVYKHVFDIVTSDLYDVYIAR